MKYNPNFNGFSFKEFSKNPDIKEFYKKNSRLEDKKVKLRISVTSSCNQRCTFCFNEGLKMNNKSLTCEQLELILKAIRPHIRNIRLTGGEPLIHKNIDRIIELCCGYAPTSITTNGVFISDHIAFLKKLDSISISMHAFDPDTFTKITNTPAENLDKVIEAIKQLQKKDYANIKINTALTNSSIKNIDRAIQFVTENNLPSLSILSLLVFNEKDKKEFVSPSVIQAKLDKRYPSEIITGSRKRYFVNKKTTIDVVWQYCILGSEICKKDGFIRITPDLTFSYCLSEGKEISFKQALEQKDLKGIEDAFLIAAKLRGSCN